MIRVGLFLRLIRGCREGLAHLLHEVWVPWEGSAALVHALYLYTKGV